jgi:hypothetical protein
MAIVVTIMIMITLAAVDFGVFMYRDVQAANCVREAVRRAVVRDYAGAANPPYCIDAGLSPTFSPAPSDSVAAGQPITATIEVAHDWMALDTFIPGLTGTIRARATMRMEGKKA